MTVIVPDISVNSKINVSMDFKYKFAIPRPITSRRCRRTQGPISVRTDSFLRYIVTWIAVFVIRRRFRAGKHMLRDKSRDKTNKEREVRQRPWRQASSYVSARPLNRSTAPNREWRAMLCLPISHFGNCYRNSCLFVVVTTYVTPVNSGSCSYSISY